MGLGIARIVMGASLLAGCTSESVPVQNQAANVAVAEAPAPAATSAAVAGSPMAQWLVGSWSFDTSCATDFIVHYNADGSLQNSEDSGSWKLDGDTITETITERFEMGSDGPQKIEPAENRAYKVERRDADNGVLTYRGKKIPIQRC